MLNYEDLLSKIYEEEKIELVLEAIGCHHLHYEQGGSLIVAARPNGDNPRAVQVKNDYGLRSIIRTTNTRGDLIEIVRELMEFKYPSEAKDYLMNICGYDETTDYEEPPLVWLTKIKRQRKFYDLEYEMPILDLEVLSQFVYGDIKQFNDDRIPTWVLEIFNIGYDSITKRITIPIFDINGNLCGIKGRTTVKEEESYWKFFFIYPCDQSKTLYNYHRSKDICKNSEVLLFEAEKSPMQMWGYGIENTMAIGSSGISLYQMNLLLSLNCDIVLCFDKGLNLEKVINPIATFFNGKRNVYLINDSNDILPPKASPSDCGIEVWNELYSSKTKICEA